eukprot:4226246-Amphidinium_carterae.1
MFVFGHHSSRECPPGHSSAYAVAVAAHISCLADIGHLVWFAVASIVAAALEFELPTIHRGCLVVAWFVLSPNKGSCGGPCVCSLNHLCQWQSSMLGSDTAWVAHINDTEGLPCFIDTSATAR